MKQLETPRLYLRPLTPGDHDALYRIYAEPEVARNLITRPRSIEEFRQPFDQMVELSSTLGMWAMLHKDDGRLIGRCGYYPFSGPPVGTPELAYLLSRAHWGMGLATEAAARCLQYAFVARRWPEVVAVVRPENTASTRVLSKLGMELVRRMEIRGVPADLYQISRSSRPDRPQESNRGAE